MKKVVLMVTMLAAMLSDVKAEVDPNFYIYLCFGQSNMEGYAQWEMIDEEVDSRFQMLATTNFDKPKRTMGEWYIANCPIVSPIGKLGPTDYFGRTMVAALPTNVTVGVVAVAIGSTPIELFDKDKYETTLKNNYDQWWAKMTILCYGGNPYGRLIEMAKKAQSVGVIKGILLHQGCSNNAQADWPNKVKKIYNDMLKDLGLTAEKVPIFVGETEREDMGGGCWQHNAVVAKIPEFIPTGHIVSSEGLPGNGMDPWHFSAVGYRILGKRYAFEALRVMGFENRINNDYVMPGNLKLFFTPKSYEDYVIDKPGTIVPLRLKCKFADNHSEDMTSEATFCSTDMTITDGHVMLGQAGSRGTVVAYFTDFFGKEHKVPILFEASDETTMDINSEYMDKLNNNIYTLQGVEMGKKYHWENFPNGIYIMNGKKIVKH
jgi:hypothetical protein